MASVAQDKNPDSFQWKLRPSVRRLADGSFAVLPCSLSRLHSSCQALLRPLCHGFAVTAGGSCSSSAPDPWLSRLPQELPSILCFPAPASRPCRKAWWWQDCLPLKPQSKAAQSGSCSCSAVWVTVGQGSAFSATGWSSSHRASSMSEWALRALLALSTALRDSSCEPWLFPGTGVSE